MSRSLRLTLLRLPPASSMPRLTFEKSERCESVAFCATPRHGVIPARVYEGFPAASVSVHVPGALLSLRALGGHDLGTVEMMVPQGKI